MINLLVVCLAVWTYLGVVTWLAWLYRKELLDFLFREFDEAMDRAIDGYRKWQATINEQSGNPAA
jgi:hypothetical protein